MELFTRITDWVKQLKIYSESVGKDVNYEEYKILILGDKAVGKTSICNRFCQNEFSLEIKPSTLFSIISLSINIRSDILS